MPILAKTPETLLRSEDVEQGDAVPILAKTPRMRRRLENVEEGVGFAGEPPRSAARPSLWAALGTVHILLGLSLAVTLLAWKLGAVHLLTGGGSVPRLPDAAAVAAGLQAKESPSTVHTMSDGKDDAVPANDTVVANDIAAHAEEPVESATNEIVDTVESAPNDTVESEPRAQDAGREARIARLKDMGIHRSSKGSAASPRTTRSCRYSSCRASDRRRRAGRRSRAPASARAGCC